MFPWLFVIILLFISSVFFSGYFRVITEKIAISITSAEQESNLGNIMFSEISGVTYCDIYKTNRYIRSIDKDYLSEINNAFELIFINLNIENSILFPGGKLLVPYNILESEDGPFILIKIIKLTKEALKNKKAIAEFFSKQRGKALLIYIFGNFTDLNFYRHNGLLISLDSTSYVLDEGFTENEWLKLKNLCKL